MTGPAGSTLEIAVGTVDVTPVAPPWPSLWMGGYGWDRRGDHGDVARRLRAHCAVIYDDGSPNVLLRVDAISLPRDLHQDIRNRVVALGVASTDFLVTASHTHSGAFLGHTHPDPYVLMGLAPEDIAAIDGSTSIFSDLLVQLVSDTLAQDSTPVTLGYGVGSAEIGFNRAGFDTVPTDVPVLVARSTADGSPVAVLFGYACHPVSRGKDEVFDSDYPGFASEAVEAALGVPALFFQGPAGDIDPVPPHQPDQVANLGQQLADAVLDVVNNGDLSPVAGPIRTQLTEIELPFQVNTADPTVVNRLRAQFQDRFDHNPEDSDLHRHARVMLADLDAGGLPTSVPMVLQRWRFAGLAIMALGHEVLSEYQALVQALTSEPCWVLGYANETQCYVPPDQVAWAGGDENNGYEAGWNGDPTIAADGSSMISYAWPCPLAFSPNGTTPPAAGSTQKAVLDACAALLAPDPAPAPVART